MVSRKISARAAGSAADAPLPLHFESPQSWAVWLEANHSGSTGVWLRLSKKGSKLKSVSYQQALEVALCYGWIDAQRRPEDKAAWLLRFVPRAARSLWSKVNREKVISLIASGQMKAAGLEAIEQAKQNGRWDAAYDAPSAATVPDDLQVALEASPEAKTFFATLNRANRYAILWRIQTVKKAETRARKIKEFVEMLERKEKIHP